MEKKITDYMVVYERYRVKRGETPFSATGAFRENMEELIRRGWEPIGGIAIDDAGLEIALSQAVVRRG